MRGAPVPSSPSSDLDTDTRGEANLATSRRWIWKHFVENILGTVFCRPNSGRKNRYAEMSILTSGFRTVAANVKTQVQKFHTSSVPTNLKLSRSFPFQAIKFGRNVVETTPRMPMAHLNRSMSGSGASPVVPSTSYKTPELSKVSESRARKFCEMSNEELLPYAAKDDPSACRERLIREIMAVDNVSWDDAQPKILEINAANKAFGTYFYGLGYLASTPYVFGVTASIAAALASFPLCFHLDTAKIFNDRYVTADLAEEKDLETWLEVGSWSWSWMEPVLGQISFLLLCFQFARNQMVNLRWRPYSHALRNIRSRRLQARYPRYNGMVLHQFSVNANWF